MADSGDQRPDRQREGIEKKNILSDELLVIIMSNKGSM